MRPACPAVRTFRPCAGWNLPALSFAVEEAGIAQREQRPARKYYELTTSGRSGLAEAAARYRLADPAPLRIGRPSRTES